ncbi:rhamnogalacturonan acetylesterase [Roseateles sp. SL47]|uniref:rhamnogalacturonan acetylesterase n=1 Tax=Roseateles sp. SL47 TaxID=2995138 RepID=UPI002270EDC1|nr:rhamnogalacturonan acetylesterase [Roseateles sp. SL47]WAC71491.1 rhamnogalacturonan acetylesterase [Roseateles sp. SL47]
MGKTRRNTALGRTLHRLVLAAGMVAGSAHADSLRVILVGDSTMAPRSGYGDALCARFKPEVTCLNLAKGGRSTKSYRAEGLWDQVLVLLRDRPAGQTDVVMMQFGHNDQPGKPGRSTELATEFPANLERYAQDIKPTGARLVLLTPLTRRSFDTQGQLRNELRPWAQTTLRIGAEQGVPVLDLNAASHAAVQAMGETEAETLAMLPRPPGPPASPASSIGANNPGFDYTHLGPKGADLFSGMVQKQLQTAWPELSRWMR